MFSYWLIAYLVLGGAAIVQGLLVAINVYEHRRRAIVRQKKIPNYAPSGRVLVISPCKGDEPGLEANLRAVLAQDYPDYEVAFVVEDADDPACNVIRRAMAAEPRVSARLIIAGHAENCGQKVRNLRAATAGLADDIRHLAFFDSDGRPKPFALRTAIYKHYLPQIGATTGYRWLIPARPTIANQLVAAINANVMAVLGRSSHQFVWGGSWAIRRETFERLGIRDAWQGTLSDDLVASRVLRNAGLEVRFDPACVLTSPVDLNWPQMFEFVRRQYSITRHYAFHWWLAALAAASVSNLAWIASVVLFAIQLSAKSELAWLPVGMLAALYALGAYRGWGIQSLAKVYSPEHCNELRGVRYWHIACGFAVNFVQWLGLLASAFGNGIRWRSIDYRLNATGRVIFKRIVVEKRRSYGTSETNETYETRGSLLSHSSQSSHKSYPLSH
jgi:cellulose synthase/poly-beta-1,6-N-acetylglucosamine synthase-like glycosyltransferase